MRLVAADLTLLDAAAESDETLAGALGVEVAPGWNASSERGRGFATAAVCEMLRVAWAAPEVTSVIAHTLAEPGPSVRVLEKTGFKREAEIEDPDDGPVWRFRTRG